MVSRVDPRVDHKRVLRRFGHAVRTNEYHNGRNNLFPQDMIRA